MRREGSDMEKNTWRVMGRGFETIGCARLA